MSTFRDVIEDAFKEIGVLRKGESADADEIQDGLTALNRMMNSWRLSGIDLEYLTETSVSDVFPYPDEDEGPVVYNLALKLAGSYGVQVSAETAAYAAEGLQQIRNKYLVIRPLSADPGLLYAPNVIR